MAAASLAAATGATLSAAGPALAAESCHAAGPCVFVHVVGPGGPLRVEEFSRADLNADPDITNTAYPSRTGGHPSLDLAIADGVSLWYLATKFTGLGADALVSADVVGVKGPSAGAPPATVSFSGADLQETPTTFLDQHRPLLNSGGSTDPFLTLYRPLRDDQDNNLDDSLTDSLENGPIDVTFTVRATPVTVTAHASNANPLPGGTITLTAAVVGSASVKDPVFTWDFDDSTPARTGPSVRHQFNGRAGDSFQVAVTLTGGDGETGHKTVLVKLGKPPPAGTGHQPGTGSNTNQHAPASGPASGNGHQLGAPRTTNGSAGGANTPATHAVPSAPTKVTASAEDLTLPLVTGQLIGGPETVTPVNLADEAASASAPGARTPPADSHDLPAWFGMAVGVLVLLGTGALSEIRPNVRSLHIPSRLRGSKP